MYEWRSVSAFRSEKREKIDSKDGIYSIVTEFKNGSMNCATFDVGGTLQAGNSID